MRPMVVPVRGFLLLALCTGLVLGTALAEATAGTTTRVSVSSTGVEGIMSSYSSSVSNDGRYVAFQSTSSFVASDTNAARDIFVHDGLTGATVRASVDSTGAQTNNESSAPSISSDGRYVAFYSGATNLVAGDTNGRGDVFVRDLVAGTTTRVSVDSAGVEGDTTSESPSISADGRYVAFVSRATNLVVGDTNADYDVFVHDRVDGTTTRASVDSAEVQGAGFSNAPAISPDGQSVAFCSDSALVVGDTNVLNDIYVRDLVAGTTVRVSVGSAGTQGDGQTGTESSISTNGHYVSFRSSATNLVPGDTNGGDDVFVRDVVAGTTSLVSVSTTGGSGDGWSGNSSISADGRSVAFSSGASNLVAGDSNAKSDVFVLDRATGTTTRVSVDSSGVAGNDGSFGPDISADGRYVAFDSVAGNLVAGDTNLGTDVFVHDRGPLRGVTSLALTSRSKNPLAYGASFVVTGTLTSGSSGTVGQQVILQSAAPGAVLKDTSMQATTGANGVFSFSAKPKSKTYYRVRFAGSSTYLASDPTTTTVYAIPKVSLGNPVAPKTMRSSKLYTVYGSLKPRHSAGAKSVLVYKYKKIGGKWRPKGSVKAKAYNYKGYSRYKVRVKLTPGGKWRLRAYAPADGGHAKTWSRGFDYITVK